MDSMNVYMYIAKTLDKDVIIEEQRKRNGNETSTSKRITREKLLGKNLLYMDLKEMIYDIPKEKGKKGSTLQAYVEMTTNIRPLRDVF